MPETPEMTESKRRWTFGDVSVFPPAFETFQQDIGEMMDAIASQPAEPEKTPVLEDPPDFESVFPSEGEVAITGHHVPNSLYLIRVEYGTGDQSVVTEFRSTEDMRWKIEQTTGGVMQVTAVRVSTRLDALLVDHLLRDILGKKNSNA